MPGNRDTLVVIKKLPFDPDQLDCQAGAFLEAVREAVGEARAARAAGTLKLADIGFVPQSGLVELRMYFRAADRLETLF